MKILTRIMATLTELFTGDDSERITEDNKKLAVLQVGISVFAILFYIGLIVLWIVGMTCVNKVGIRVMLGIIGFLAISLIFRTICLLVRSFGKRRS